jgi:hypothetical protein
MRSDLRRGLFKGAMVEIGEVGATGKDDDVSSMLREGDCEVSVGEGEAGGVGKLSCWGGMSLCGCW